MPVELHHTIVASRDKTVSAAFLAEMLGLPEPKAFGPFAMVQVDNGVTLDFADSDGPITSQHYAFLIGEDDFDEVFARVEQRDLPYWADPGKQQTGQINRRQGGRGFYFEDPDGHLLEVLTRAEAPAG
jgi:catechol 2,3-dioxygenase-like lactoylglutathione lyase family enzyme